MDLTLLNLWSFLFSVGPPPPSLVAHMVKKKKNPPAVHKTFLDIWVRKIPWRREWQSMPIFLAGKFHGQRSLAGCSPWSWKELDMTERLTLSLFFTSFYPDLFIVFTELFPSPLTLPPLSPLLFIQLS